METLVLRPTAVLTYETCPELYRLQYHLRIRTPTTSHALAFGKAGHKAVLSYAQAHAQGGEIDPAPVFEQAWTELLDTHVVNFTRYRPDELLAIGKKLAGDFPAHWQTLGLKVASGGGRLLLENRLRARIGDDVVLSGEPDLVTELPDGNIAIPDVKFPASASFKDFASVSDQLSAYQLLVRVNRPVLGLGTKRVTQVGFIEGVKKTSPAWKGSMVAAHSDDQLGAYVQKLQMTAALIRKGYFPKRSAAAYNSPCAQCDMADLCLRKNPSGLVSPLGDVMDLAYGPAHTPISVAA